MGLASDIKAMKDVQRIKSGGIASISVSSITNMIINLPDANRSLSKEDFEKVHTVYKTLRKCTTPIDMDISEYYRVAVDILREFDKVVPCESYLGMESFEAKLLMQEVRRTAPVVSSSSSLGNITPTEEVTKKKPTKKVKLMPTIFVILIVCVSLFYYWLHCVSIIREPISGYYYIGTSAFNEDIYLHRILHIDSGKVEEIYLDSDDCNFLYVIRYNTNWKHWKQFLSSKEIQPVGDIFFRTREHIDGTYLITLDMKTKDSIAFYRNYDGESNVEYSKASKSDIDHYNFDIYVYDDGSISICEGDLDRIEPIDMGSTFNRIMIDHINRRFKEADSY